MDGIYVKPDMYIIAVLCCQVDKSKLEDDGVYQCVVRNEYGSVNSDCVRVSIATSIWDDFAPEPCK